MNCHEHDKKWVIEQLCRLPPTLRPGAEKAYSELYASGATRRECNTRLREYADKVTNRVIHKKL